MATASSSDLRTPFLRLTVILVLGLAGATALAVLGATGPAILSVEQAIFGLAAALFVTAAVTAVLMVRVGQAFTELRELRAQNEAIQAQLNSKNQGQHVIFLDGLGERFASRLNNHGIITVPQLVSADVGRVSAAVGVPAATVEEWQAMGRFMQVRGISPQAAGALVRSGIRTVAELARAKPAGVVANLTANAEARRRWPAVENLTEQEAARWVQGAKQRLNADLHA